LLQGSGDFFLLNVSGEKFLVNGEVPGNFEVAIFATHEVDMVWVVILIGVF
jgi:hypothetical protein